MCNNCLKHQSLLLSADAVIRISRKVAAPSSPVRSSNGSVDEHWEFLYVAADLTVLLWFLASRVVTVLPVSVVKMLSLCFAPADIAAAGVAAFSGLVERNRQHR